MRPLVSRRAATAVVCAALVLGAAGPAAASAHIATRDAGAHTARSPLPLSPAPGKQAEALQDVVTPVADLIKDVLATGHGRLSAAEAKKHSAAITDALAAMKDATPGSSRAALPTEGHGKAAPADLTDDALAALKQVTDALIDAARTGDTTGVVTQVTAVVTSLVNLILATLLGSALPPAALPDLVDLPPLPVTPQLPVTPELPATSEVPATPELPPTSEAPATPVTPAAPATPELPAKPAVAGLPT
jgi:hypothetical protein